MCKQWCRVEGLNRCSLCVFVSEILPHFLPRFPNLLKFVSSLVISNNLLSETCSHIQVLNLNCILMTETSGEILGVNDFDDDGISAIATGCCNLGKVLLRGRIGIGSQGVVSLVNFSQKLVHLNLDSFTRITDEALEAIGMTSSLRVLYLQGCCLITEAGLDFLSQGRLPNTLEELNLAKCDRITDNGMMSLREIRCLQLLHLANCGIRVTDTGGKAITAMKSLRRLYLSGLINGSDVTVAAIAEHCKNLQTLDLSGCKLVTGHCRRRHPKSLWDLRLVCIADFSLNHLEQLVFGCQSLGVIVLDEKWKTSISMAAQVTSIRPNCQIFWCDKQTENKEFSIKR